MPSPNFVPNILVSVYEDRSSIDPDTDTPDETEVLAQQLPSRQALNDDQATFTGATDFFVRRFYFEPGAPIKRLNGGPLTFSYWFRIDSPPYPIYLVVDTDMRYDESGLPVCIYVYARRHLESSPAP